MKKRLLITTLCLLIASYGFNQDYKTALGIKGGFPGVGAFNIKHHLSGKSALEGSIGGGANLLWFQGLYEINNPIENGFNFYYGGGFDLGIWTYRNNYYGPGYYNHHNDFYLGHRYHGHRAFGGLDGVIGLEYTFEKIPLNLAVDASPVLRLFPNVGFALYANVAARFAIK